MLDVSFDAVVDFWENLSCRYLNPKLLVVREEHDWKIDLLLYQGTTSKCQLGIMHDK